MINVLALDASLRSTGWAANTTRDGTTRHHHGHLTPRTHNGQRWQQLTGPARLAWIAAQIRTLAREHHTQLVAIEGYAHASRHSTHVIGELGGVIRTTLWGAGIPYLEIAPKTLKMWACNNGNADKNAMIAAANDLTHYRGSQPDEADAILLHALTCDALGTPWATPTHDRRHQALTPVTRAIEDLNITPVLDQHQEQ